MNRPTLVIMAAGMGSRYGGLKQLDPVTDEGEIIMDFSLYDAMMAGFDRAVFVIKEEMAEAFSELIEKRAGKYMETAFAYQKTDDLPEGYNPRGVIALLNERRDLRLMLYTAAASPSTGRLPSSTRTTITDRPDST